MARTGETINIQDAYQDGRFQRDIDIRTGFITKTVLCMPVRSGLSAGKEGRKIIG